MPNCKLTIIQENKYGRLRQSFDLNLPIICFPISSPARANQKPPANILRISGSDEVKKVIKLPKMQKMFTILCAVLAMSSSAWASRRCYSCLAEQGSDACNDPVDIRNMDVERCSAEDVYCIKTTFKTFDGKNREDGKEMIMRGCGTPDNCFNPTNKIMKTMKAKMAGVTLRRRNIKETNCNVCSMNLCNHASSVGISAALISVSLLLVGLLM